MSDKLHFLGLMEVIAESLQESDDEAIAEVASKILGKKVKAVDEYYFEIEE